MAVVVVRYLHDGRLDPTFGNGGVVRTDFPRRVQKVVEIAVNQQGQIVVIAVDGDAVLVANYLVGGGPNLAFSHDGKAVLPFPFVPADAAIDRQVDVALGQRAAAAPGVLDLPVAPAARLVAAGETGVDFNGLFTLACYRPFDHVDATFGNSGFVFTNFLEEGGSARATCVTVDRQHRIAAAGAIVHADGQTHFAVARYLSSGAIDNGFSANGRTVTHFNARSEARAATFAGGQGRLVVAGFVGNRDFALARYLDDGKLDTAFSGDGRIVTQFRNGNSVVNAVKADGRGRVVAAGFAGTHFAIARYLANGSLDATFSGDGRATTDIPGSSHSGANGLYIDPADETITAVGVASGEFGVARFRENGSLDPTFSNDGRVRTVIGVGNEASHAHAVVADPQGRIVVAGVVDEDFVV